jgi:hypothetical protein
VRRPRIDEYDVGSYLVPTLDVHDVLSRDAGGAMHADGAPRYDYEALNRGDDLCREHAWDLARTLGFQGPRTERVSYQSGLLPKSEDVMVNGDQIATYSYGRAYFEPGEPRTAPCETCGQETLVDAGGYED